METRKQMMVSRMESRRKKILFPIFFLLITFAITAVIYCIFAAYRPPKHDLNAVVGIPNPEESYLYGTVETEYGYSISMAANLYRQENGEIKTYYTNPLNNSCYLRYELIDSDTKKILHSTGFIKQGEYVEAIKDKRIKNKKYNITVRVYAYDPDNFTSCGTTDLKLLLQPW